ncbi:hypothetical protein EBT31_20855, partial [bacterium]|nr:hypothetical protein [bacterium]
YSSTAPGTQQGELRVLYSEGGSEGSSEGNREGSLGGSQGGHQKGKRVGIPLNIKVSSGGTDNALDKKAIVYSFSTLPEDKIPGAMCFNTMAQAIKHNPKLERDPWKEYYYLYVDKNDGTVLVRSMCDVQNYVSNPQNWLQIAWKREKALETHVNPDLAECYDRIRGTLADSLLKLFAGSHELLSEEELQAWKMKYMCK